MMLFLGLSRIRYTSLWFVGCPEKKSSLLKWQRGAWDTLSIQLLMCTSIIFSVLCFSCERLHKCIIFCKIANLKGLNLNDNSIELEHTICSIYATEWRIEICCIISTLWMSDLSTLSIDFIQFWKIKQWTQ